MTKKFTRAIVVCQMLIILFHAGLQAQDCVMVGPAKISVYFNTELSDFPKEWRKDTWNLQITKIDLLDRNCLVNTMQKALLKYPTKVLKKNLKGVCFSKTIFLSGLEFGGTYSVNKRRVYLTDNGIENGYTQQYIEGSFHHEFSSIIMKRYNKFFDKEAWIAANPEGFEYGDGGIEALKTENTSLKLDSALFGQGFLNEYSLASLEEDFNCYAEFLFLSDRDFWKAWEQSVAVRRKTEILISLYHSIDPSFKLEYFRDAIPN